MLHNRLQDTKTHRIIDDIQPLAPQQEGMAELIDWAIGVPTSTIFGHFSCHNAGRGSGRNLSRRGYTYLYSSDKRLH